MFLTSFQKLRELWLAKALAIHLLLICTCCHLRHLTSYNLIFIPSLCPALFNKLHILLASDSSSTCDNLLGQINDNLVSEDLNLVSVSIACIRSALSLLKRHKNDGTNLSSNHFIHALPAIELFVADLFTSILHHGYMPTVLRDCILVPIPKGNKDPTLSDNFRSVALAPTLSKALEWCILLNYSGYFTTSDLQFGFKRQLSTTLCTGTGPGLIKNVVSKFVHAGSQVYGCFLDTSKAFDWVNHEVLFSKLDLPLALNRFLVSWYRSQRMQVRWNNSLSPLFSATNGVQQGMFYHLSYLQSILMTSSPA